MNRLWIIYAERNTVLGKAICQTVPSFGAIALGSVRIGDVVAGRYELTEYLGSAAFSKAVQAVDLDTGDVVCLKIVKNNKDYFDQSLDEIKLLR